MIFIAFSLGQLAYGQLDIAAELLRETLQLQFFSLSSTYKCNFLGADNKQ